MRDFLRRLFVNPAWDSEGRLKILLPRQSDPVACAVDGIPSATTARALLLFCDAFDIPEDQAFCLRPSDTIGNIYQAVVAPTHDDLETERLIMNLEEASGHQMTDAGIRSLVTIADVVRWLHEHTTR